APRRTKMIRRLDIHSGCQSTPPPSLRTFPPVGLTTKSPRLRPPLLANAISAPLGDHATPSIDATSLVARMRRARPDRVSSTYSPGAPPTVQERPKARCVA